MIKNGPGAKGTELDDLSSKLAKIHIGGLFPKEPCADNKGFETALMSCAEVIHERRLLYHNEFPRLELVSIEPKLRQGIENYIYFLNTLPISGKKTPGKSLELQQALNSIQKDLARLDNFLWFMFPYGVMDFISEYILALIGKMEFIIYNVLEQNTTSKLVIQPLIKTIIKLYTYVLNIPNVSNEIKRMAIENSHYWLDHISSKGSKEEAVLQLGVLNSQLILEIGEGNLSWAMKTLELAKTLSKRAEIDGGVSLNCYLLASKFSEEKQFTHAYYWMQEHLAGNQVAITQQLPFELQLLFGQNGLEIQTRERLQEYRKKHHESVTAFLKENEVDGKVIRDSEKEILKIKADLFNPELALREILKRLGTKLKVNIGFDKKDASKSFLYIWPLIEVPLVELSSIIRTINRVRIDFRQREEERKANEQRKEKPVEPRHNANSGPLSNDKTSVSSLTPPPQEHDVQTSAVEKTAPAPVSPDPVSKDDNLSGFDFKLEEARYKALKEQEKRERENQRATPSDAAELGFDETTIGATTKISQCRLRGYGETPFFVGYLGEENPASLTADSKEQIINSLFRDPKIVPKEGESGFHRVNGVLVGKHKAFPNRLIPRLIQKAPVGIFYGFGNFIDYHSGSDKKTFEDKIDKIPTQTVSCKK